MIELVVMMVVVRSSKDDSGGERVGEDDGDGSSKEW